MFTSQIKNSSHSTGPVTIYSKNRHLAISDLIFNSINFINLQNCLRMTHIALNCPDQIASGTILIVIFLLNHNYFLNLIRGNNHENLHLYHSLQFKIDFHIHVILPKTYTEAGLILLIFILREN